MTITGILEPTPDGWELVTRNRTASVDLGDGDNLAIMDPTEPGAEWVEGRIEFSTPRDGYYFAVDGGNARFAGELLRDLTARDLVFSHDTSRGARR